MLLAMESNETLLKLDNLNKIHFIGIGGIGMSALAFNLISKGKKISGSDKKDSKIIEQLISLGADIKLSHDENNISSDTDLVVISTAINKNNPEIRKALDLGIRICHRADVLNLLLRSHNSIAVTGTHGKTSTSAMVSQILFESGLNPNALIGGEANFFHSNCISGKSNYLVAEVDESDQSIKNLSANYAIITNLEVDHLDHYKDLNEIINIMNKFLSNLPNDSKLIICKDSYGNNKLLENYYKEYITYSLIDDKADYKAVDIFLAKNYSKFKVKHRGMILGEFTVPVAGLHYVSNSLASIILSLEIGIDIEDIKSALANYKGVKRRFEIVGNSNDTMIVDDYAHHPTEIRATLSSASLYQKYLTVVFQPHRYSRTKSLLNDFSCSFESADRIILTDVFSAGELYEDYQIDSEDLYNLVKSNYPEKEVYYIKTLDEVKNFILSKHIPNHMVITMGAGTITNLSKDLAEGLNFFQKV